jgi:hypothetical protein
VLNLYDISESATKYFSVEQLRTYPTHDSEASPLPDFYLGNNVLGSPSGDRV